MAFAETYKLSAIKQGATQLDTPIVLCRTRNRCQKKYLRVTRCLALWCTPAGSAGDHAEPPPCAPMAHARR